MIIVTGGAGFIGCNIIKRLNAIQRKDIIVVDDLEYGQKYINLANLSIYDYIDKDDFIKNFIVSSDKPYIKNIDVIFHEGACSSTTEWNGKYMMNNNYQYSKKILFYCIAQKIPFIYASSASVYGNNINHDKYNEHPTNIYSYSKFLFDEYVRKTLKKKITSQVCGLRYFNVYGPHEEHKKTMASIIFRLYTQIKKQEFPTLFINSDKFKRDFIHINNVVDVNLWIWNNNISGIFDCGTGIAESFESVGYSVLNFFKKKTIKYIPMPIELQKHYQTFTKANIYPLRKLGYHNPFMTIQKGIPEYLSWLNVPK